MNTTVTQSAAQPILDRHDRCMSLNYGRYPVALVRGRGVHVWDAEGKKYLDLFAGFGGPILGHCHRDLVRAVSTQAKKLWHVGNLFHTEPQTLVAEAIHRHGFGGRSFFCHSGADANEAALKLARLYGKANPGKASAPNGRYKVICALNSFHGRTFGTMVATAGEKVRQGFEPWLPGFTHVPFNDLGAVERAIDDETVAVLIEPIQGEGGINVPDDGYLPGLRKLCDERDLLLICDEVWTGCGRTGKWFAHQHWLSEPGRVAPATASPDVMTLAKGVGGGLAVGVMCAKPKVAELFDHRRYGGAIHATTLGGNCLAMAASAALFHVIERDGLLAHTATLGEHALARLRAFAGRCPKVRQVRGKGLFLGIELDPALKAADIVNRCLERGVIINGTQQTVLRLAPALVITGSQLDRGLRVVEKAIQGA